MSLRIVSGVLCPTVANGNATIKLKSNSIVGGSATISNACEYGGSTDYDSEPCKAISIRAFDGQPDSINLTDTFEADGTIKHARVKIHWKCVGGEIKEITYFFAGEE